MTFSMQVDAGNMDLMGSFTLEETAVFRQAVESQISQGTKALCINFDGVRYVDSAGIGAIVSAERSFRKVGGNLRLVNVSPEILRVLHTMKLDSVLKIETT